MAPFRKWPAILHTIRRSVDKALHGSAADLFSAMGVFETTAAGLSWGRCGSQAAPRRSRRHPDAVACAIVGRDTGRFQSVSFPGIRGASVTPSYALMGPATIFGRFFLPVIFATW